jgi:tyrosine-protein phosphatase
MPPPRLPAPLDTAKNVKNLSLNVNPIVLQRPATAHGFEGSHAFSAPSSPMKDAPRTGRRKPTNLTIRTPGFQQLSFPRAGLDVPPTPSSRPALHHMASSPALASLASPTKVPQGLFLHLPTSGSVHSGSISGPNSDSSASSQPLNISLPKLREEDEMHGLKSQETQEKGYPDGPVLIYDEGLYLFLEPTADEASKFDTVVNVAKEIKCPFATVASKPEITEPQTAISEMSFKSAWEWPRASEIPTPTTPRPSSFYQPKCPEYLHVPWDHNSEILDDLYCLCRLIEERIQAGKKVLIHCQLGVSRSASLVIAYGLYKGYQPDFHSMYMAVKKRSQWVGPNMSLIYQLTDFRSKVVKGVYGDHCYNPSPAWWEIRASNPFPTADTPVAKASSWQTPRANEYATQENAKTPVAQSRNFTPPTVKAAPPLKLNKALPPVPLFPKDTSVATPVKLSQILYSIAKPSPPQQTFVEEKPVAQPASPRPFPFREQFEEKPSHQMAMPQAKTPKLGLKIDSPRMDLAMQDVPDTPSLLSPRASEFMASPFGITMAGDLATVPTRAKSLKPSKSFVLPRHQVILPPAHLNMAEDRVPTPFDPRSPHQHGETAEILRHIDDFL